MARNAEPKTYPVGIVGEINYQSAIRRCSAGQRVQIVHEIGNPNDEKALAVLTEMGDTIGYIARDSWLRDCIHEESHGCEASIKSIGNGDADKLGVVLDVALAGRGVPTRQFNRLRNTTPTSQTIPASHEMKVYSAQTKGFFARWFGN